jgi:ubiquinone/menaquinone biosynthesis C-methylase UbiE
MDEALKQVERYWDAYAAGLDVQGTPWGSREFFAAIKAEHDQAYAYANHILDLAKLEGRSLLELACGIGLDTIEFARHGAAVTAIDLSATCLDLAERQLAYHNLQATLEIGNAESLRYPANSFDFVVARGILMFTRKASRVVDEILRVLKPGGEANILLHNRFSWYVFLAKISGTNLVHEAKDPPINKFYSVWQVQKMFGKFSSYQIFFDRFPLTTTKRTGTFAQLYNQLVVPFARTIPNAIIKTFGFYIIIKAIK